MKAPEVNLTLHMLLPVFILLTVCGRLSAETIEAESVLIQLIDEVNVPAQTSGVLALNHVAEGQRVEQGQVLAQIDDLEARLTEQKASIELRIAQQMARDDIPVRSAQRKLEFNRADMQRVRLAAKQVPGSISTTQLEETELRFNQAELDLERARRELKLASMSEELKETQLKLGQRNVAIRKIVSPIRGVIVEVVRKAGEWVEPGDKVLRIVRTDRLRAQGLVPAQQVLGVSVGDAVQVSVDLSGRPSAQFSGEVIFVSPEINPVNGLVRIWAEVENQSGLLRPGLRSQMSIHPAGQ